jgi:hypothetical protein
LVKVKHLAALLLFGRLRSFGHHWFTLKRILEAN